MSRAVLTAVVVAAALGGLVLFGLGLSEYMQ